MGKAKKRIKIIKKFQYTPENLKKAINEVKNGMSYREAAKKFGVPASTIGGHVMNKHQRTGKTTNLLAEEEKQFVEWILHMLDNGFPVEKGQLLDAVKLYLDSQKRHLRQSINFKDNRPGRDWYERFLNRHPEISVRTTTEALSVDRYNLTEKSIRNWFEKVR